MDSSPTAAPPPPPAPLRDGQGRTITYLRLSLTERCNFRCSYCSPVVEERGPEDALAREEVARLVAVFAKLGVRRVRLTGGEPTLRRDLLEVVRDVRSTPGIEEVALTTNGLFLDRLAKPLVEAGVSRLNISLDTLDPERAQRISGRAATLERILAGIVAASQAGFASVKLNVVVMRGENDTELGEITRWAWRAGLTPRFIELMPFGRGEPVATAEVKALLEDQGIRLEPDGTRGWGPAYHMRGTSGDEHGIITGLVGFIGAMTENFCDGCNRVRVGADGSLRACLGGRDKLALKDLMRAGATDDALADAIRKALAGKHERHDMAAGNLMPMIGTGG